MQDLSQPKQTITFTSGKLGFRGIVYRVLMNAIVATLLYYWWPGHPIGSIAPLLFTACVLSVMVASRWTVEIDPASRRMTILRRLLLQWKQFPLWTTVLEDCGFDECSELGTRRVLPDENRPPFYYQVYIDFKRGGRHVIPVEGLTPARAEALACELSAKTGIPLRTVPENY
jgi:hypothetical protein